jgi:hypothetical protein
VLTGAENAALRALCGRASRSGAVSAQQAPHIRLHATASWGGAPRPTAPWTFLWCEITSKRRRSCGPERANQSWIEALGSTPSDAAVDDDTNVSSQKACQNVPPRSRDRRVRPRSSSWTVIHSLCCGRALRARTNARSGACNCLTTDGAALKGPRSVLRLGLCPMRRGWPP